ncbi:gliding motility protein GldM [Salibacteraceae bacterium]|jgi:gliding motility-associated protein GldM|nr:gliding motility protein GldM [Salibacteraceae bacterium]
MSLGDLPPRQKMINIMYLVLLALLAMNVSKEILHSFVIINEGLEETTGHFEDKIEATYSRFEKLELDDPIKVTPFYNRAKQVRDDANEIAELLEMIKTKVKADADQIAEDVADTTSLEHIHGKDNQEVGTYVLMGPNVPQMWGEASPEYEFSAPRLHVMIEKFNAEVADVLPELSEEELLAVQIPLHPVKMHGVEENWETANFYHLPLAAIITNLSRFQADVRNIEAEVLRRLMGQITADDFKFDKLEPKVIPLNGTYITVGDSFKAQVIVAAYSTTTQPVLEISDVKDGVIQGFDSVKLTLENPDTSNVTVQAGIATYSVVPNTAGDYEWGGVIKIKGPRGDYKPYAFTHSFKAAKPSLVISPTAMNVFYKGLENPVEISAAGMSPDDLSLSVTGCAVSTKSKPEGKYVVKPSDNLKAKEVNVTVTAKGANAPKFKPMVYRIKTVPPPTPEFLGKRGSFKMSKAQLLSGDFITAKLDDFLFDLKFRVTEFKITVSAKGKTKTYNATSNRITPEMKGVLKTMSPGQSIIIKDLVAKRSDAKVGQPLDGNLIIEIQ